MYTSENDIFGGLDPGEFALIDKLSGHLENELQDGARVVAPLGIGNHVDHELTRKAVNRLDIPLTFYADYPYASEDQGTEILAFMERSEEWQYRQIPISDNGLELWIQASRAFGSQISTFWADEKDLSLQIREFSSSMGGIKLWEAIENH